MTASGAQAAVTEVAIVGGGVIGLSIAWRLAEAGVSCTVFERGRLGSGASGASAGVVRTYFPGDPTNAALAVRSLPGYLDFQRQTGVDPGLEPVGFLVVFDRPEQVEAFTATASAQRAAGVEVELISAAAAVDRNPLLAGDQVVAAAWAPQAYLVAADQIVRGYAEAARRAGARILTEETVVTLDLERGVLATEVADHPVKAVVCAAGPWSQPIAAMARLHLPVSPRRTELLFAAPGRYPAIPLTLHARSGLRMRAHGDRLLVGMGRPGPGEARERWLDRVASQLGAVYPSLAGVALEHAWTGVWDGSPDGTPFIGRRTDRGHFLYATGFSGHGFCQAPMAGELVRDLFLGRRLAVDLAPFSAGRRLP